jgi:alpha-aminoadipic semialdehyde synthase
VKTFLSLLPHKIVKPEELKDIYEKSEKYDDKLIYICYLETKDIMEKKDEKKKTEFDNKDYLENPKNYESNFHEKILPYTKMLL